MTNKEKLDYYLKRIEINRIELESAFADGDAWERAYKKVYGERLDGKT